jgi:hypothetical protein
MTDIARGVLVAIAVENALGKLVKDGSVQAKQIDSETCYKAV